MRMTTTSDLKFRKAIESGIIAQRKEKKNNLLKIITVHKVRGFAYHLSVGTFRFCKTRSGNNPIVLGMNSLYV
jgi:hypothetical protein